MSINSTTLKRLLAGGVVTATVLGVGAGIASAQTSAQTGEPTSEEATAPAGLDEVRERHAGRRDARIDELAEFLGTTPEEIKAGLEDGMTLAEIAEVNGVSSAELEAELTARIEARIQDGLDSGRLSETEAERRLDHVDEFVGRAVDTTLEERRGLVSDRLERRQDRIQDRLDRLPDTDD